MTHTGSMRVLELWRYPIKSIGGERLEQVDVGEHGLLGDRGWVWSMRRPARSSPGVASHGC